MCSNNYQTKIYAIQLINKTTTHKNDRSLLQSHNQHQFLLTKGNPIKNSSKVKHFVIAILRKQELNLKYSYLSSK